MKKKTIIGFIVLAAIVAGFLIVVLNFGPSSGDIEELEAVEVREYEGKNLSSVHDFRENSIKGPQYIDLVDYHLDINGLVEKPKSYTYEEVISKYKSYKKVVRLDCVEGWSVDILWEGVLVKDILEKSGVLPEVKTVILHAYDGYTTSFPVSYVLDNNIMMAFKMNEIALPPERGFPFQLIAESKWGYKWIKWITQIELSDNEDYQGFWESRGYSDSGDLDKSFFD